MRPCLWRTAHRSPSHPTAPPLPFPLPCARHLPDLFYHLPLAGLIRAARSLFRFISCACSHNLPTTENNHTKSPFTQSRAYAAPRLPHTPEWEVGKVRSGCFPTSHSSVPSLRAAPFQPIYHHSRGRGSTPTLPQFAGPGHVSYLHVGPDRPIVPLRSLPSDPQTRLSPSHDSGQSHPHAPLLPLSCNCADSRLRSFSTVISRR